MKLTVKMVKERCMRNYNRGGDVIIECWTDQEIQDWINGTGDFWKEPNQKPKQVKDLNKLMKLYYDTDCERYGRGR